MAQKHPCVALSKQDRSADLGRSRFGSHDGAWTLRLSSRRSLSASFGLPHAHEPSRAASSVGVGPFLLEGLFFHPEPDVRQFSRTFTPIIRFCIRQASHSKPPGVPLQPNPYADTMRFRATDRAFGITKLWVRYPVRLPEFSEHSAPIRPVTARSFIFLSHML